MAATLDWFVAYLLLQTTDISVRLQRGLLHLHDAHHRVRIIRKNTNNGVNLVVKKHSTTRLEQVLVHERTDVDVVLGSHRRRHDGVVIVNHFLQGSNSHWISTNLVDLCTLTLKEQNNVTFKYRWKLSCGALKLTSCCSSRGFFAS